MNSKQIIYVFLAAVAILGWNAFLIQRDDALYKSYYRQQALENINKPLSTEVK